jgi:hypothetical protein
MKLREHFKKDGGTSGRNLGPQLPTVQQDKTAGRAEQPHHTLRYQQKWQESIYR